MKTDLAKVGFFVCEGPEIIAASSSGLPWCSGQLTENARPFASFFGNYSKSTAADHIFAIRLT